MKNIKKVAVIFGIVLIGLFLRLYAATHLDIVQDEPIYTAAGVRYANHMRNGEWNMLAWQEKNMEHPVLFKIMYGFVMLTQPAPDINVTIDVKRFSPIQDNIGERWVMAGRYTSLVIGELAVLALAIINPFAGLFLALQSIAVLYTSSVYLEALPLFGSILCAAFYLNWFKQIQAGQKVDRRVHWWLLLSAGALGASVASKYMYGVVGLAITLHYLLFAAQNRALRRYLGFMLAWGLLAVLAFFVFDPYLWPHPIQRLWASLTYHLEYSQSDDIGEFNYPFWQVFYWLSGSIARTVPAFKSGVPLALDLPISLLALAGLPYLWKKNPLYLIWLALGIAMLLVWPTKWTQYPMIILAPYCMSAAGALEGLLAWLRRKRSPRAAQVS